MDFHRRQPRLQEQRGSFATHFHPELTAHESNKSEKEALVPSGVFCPRQNPVLYCPKSTNILYRCCRWGAKSLHTSQTARRQKLSIHRSYHCCARAMDGCCKAARQHGSCPKKAEPSSTRWHGGSRGPAGGMTTKYPQQKPQRQGDVWGWWVAEKTDITQQST